MEITLQYFDGCPNWESTERLLTSLLDELEIEATIRRHLIGSAEAADEAGFRGSPTVLINGVDLFIDPAATFGLGCRVYRTEDGLAGAPTRDQLRNALANCL